MIISSDKARELHITHWGIDDDYNDHMKNVGSRILLNNPDVLSEPTMIKEIEHFRNIELPIFKIIVVARWNDLYFCYVERSIGYKLGYISSNYSISQMI